MSSAESLENGRNWLFQLTYGAEQAYLLNRQAETSARGLSYLENVKGRSARRLMYWSDKSLLRDLHIIESNLEEFIGAKAIVVPLQESPQTEPIEGRVTDFDLDRSQLELRVVRKLQIVNFCEPHYGNNFRQVEATPLVELQTDMPYRGRSY